MSDIVSPEDESSPNEIDTFKQVENDPNANALQRRASNMVERINEMGNTLPTLEKLSKQEQTEALTHFGEFVKPIDNAIVELKNGKIPWKQKRAMMEVYTGAIIKHQGIWLEIIEKLGANQVDLLVNLACGHNYRIQEGVDAHAIQLFKEQMLNYKINFRKKMNLKRAEVQNDSLLDDKDVTDTLFDINTMKDDEMVRIDESIKKYGLEAGIIVRRDGRSA